ncbi:hypothetical protein AJ79_10235 [Helicocarpus griseus UAMH5409]|uniref:Deoxyribonuclease NucA/NucB domain-containing protein n=1 Tax=Helicocarpus griseus UAMH5409 TaxID=1447875 RepID=A0A2B7W6J5_9EURO|nr:hypothetical protein AJ79_10235 [Helicocarpus griseus UAMH5409]
MILPALNRSYTGYLLLIISILQLFTQAENAAATSTTRTLYRTGLVIPPEFVDPGHPSLSLNESVQQVKRHADYIAKLRTGNLIRQRDFIRCWNEAPDSGAGVGSVLDHMAWCKVGPLDVISEVCSSPGNCEELGRVRFRMTLAGEGHQGNSPSDRQKMVTVILDNPQIIGAPILSDFLTVSGLCDYNQYAPCSETGGDRKTLATWMTPEGSTTWVYFHSGEGSLTGDKIAYHGFGIVFRTKDDTTTINGASFRCDSATYFPNKYGCVYLVDEVFVLTVDDKTRESADFIWTAQNRPDETFPVSESPKKIPGSVDSPDPLRRTTELNSEANYRESVKQCKLYFGEKYTKGERQCDEYPYASTAEGSKVGGLGTSHYAVLPLKGSHNTEAGTRLGIFYTTQRILREEDPFYVKLVDPDWNDYKGPERPPSGVAAPVVYQPCPNPPQLPEVMDVSPQAYPENLFNTYASITDAGWTGADSTYSVRLPDGRLLWLFSDTFLGPLNADGTRPTSAKLINNAFVAQSGDLLTTITGGSRRNPTALMPPVIDNRWYWLGDRMMPRIDGTDYLQVMFQEYRGTNDGPILAFEFVRNVVATFDLADLTKPIWIDPLPSETGTAWGSALLPASRSGDGYTYIYGVSNDRVNKKMRIARVAGSDLSRADKWQYFRTSPTGDNNWMRSESEGNDYLEGVANEYSVTP